MVIKRSLCYTVGVLRKQQKTVTNTIRRQEKGTLGYLPAPNHDYG